MRITHIVGLKDGIHSIQIKIPVKGSFSFCVVLMTEKAVTGDPLRVWTKGDPIASAADFTSCPIATSLGILGRKWTMLILRDIAMRKMERFHELLKSIPGITPRVLSLRLRELEEAGMITRVENRKTPRFVRWNLTEMGWDALPILMSYVAFGSKWYAPAVFADGKPREMNDIYPQENLSEMFVNLNVNVAEIRKIQKTQGSKIGSEWKTPAKS